MIDKHLLELMSIEGFCNMYYQYCKEYDTQEKAYEAVERLYMANFGQRRYANFESFRQMRNRMLKKCN